MSVEHIEGDLLTWPAGITVLAQNCNCQNLFEAGIALAIRQKCPAAYEADTNAYQELARHGETREMLGTFSVAEVGDDKKIVNLYGQFTTGTERRQLNYEEFYNALDSLREALNVAHAAGRSYVLGLPYRIGCGLAGAKWSIVEAMIHDLFDDAPTRCVIVRLPNS